MIIRALWVCITKIYDIHIGHMQANPFCLFIIRKYRTMFAHCLARCVRCIYGIKTVCTVHISGIYCMYKYGIQYVFLYVQYIVPTENMQYGIVLPPVN